ncbi:MAG: acyl-CoA dehydrogenase family protein [Novosphingobium sp.]
MPDLAGAREKIRAWLELNCPPEMRESVLDNSDACWGGRKFTFKNEVQRLLLQRCAERDFTVPDWPTEHGGAGMSPEEAKVWRAEMARIGARPLLSSFGIWMLCPALLKFGTEEQKRHYLPTIAPGEIRWCKGYCEPGAGSDLVGLQTFGEDRGYHWLVNGRKIWTNYADKAGWIVCLVRTDKTDKYHGISFLLFDMQSPGVSPSRISMKIWAIIYLTQWNEGAIRGAWHRNPALSWKPSATSRTLT